MSDLKEYWNESIRLNNLGVRYLEQGLLQQAQACFRNASEYCEEASYESSVDGYGVYPNHWVSLSQAFPSMPAYMDNCETVMKPLHPAALCIGNNDIPKDTFVPDVERRKAVYTTRLDWIIDFNLATILQLSALTTQSPTADNQQQLQEAYQIFDEMSDDVAEWTNYSASIDIGIFLMMMFQNQRIICKHLGNPTLASRFLLQIRHIQQSIGAITMQLSGTSCLNGGRQQSGPTSGTNHCAPTA